MTMVKIEKTKKKMKPNKKIKMKKQMMKRKYVCLKVIMAKIIYH